MEDITLNIDGDWLIIRPTVRFKNWFFAREKLFPTFDWHKPSEGFRAHIRDFGDIRNILKELEINNVFRVNISETTFKKIYESALNNKDDRVVERVEINCPLDLSLVKFPPLVGKHPNENYQVEDISMALKYNRLIMNWDVALGKSYAKTVIYENLYKNAFINKCILVTTKIGTYNLKNEILKFSTSLKENDIEEYTTVMGLSKDQRRVFEKSRAKMMIFNHITLRNILKEYPNNMSATRAINYWINGGIDEPFLSSKATPYKDFSKKGLIFLDESHKYGNSKSDLYSVLKGVIKCFYFRYEFTGTFADKEEKRYSQFCLLDESLVNFQSFNKWLYKYNDMNNKWTKFGKGLNPKGWYHSKLRELDKSLVEKEYIVKRKIADCLELEEAIVEPTIKIDMGEKQYAMLQRASGKKYAEYASSIVEGGKFDKQSTFIAMMCLINNPFALVDRDLSGVDIFKYDYQKDNEKLQVVDEIIDNHENEKGIIWYYHPATKEFLKQRYKNNILVFDDKITDKDKFKEIQKFKKDGKTSLIALSLISDNSSLTITECSFEVFLESTLSGNDYIQARGRIHRPGKQRASHTYHICYNVNMDRQLHEIFLGKATMLKEQFDTKSYTKQDFFNLFI